MIEESSPDDMSEIDLESSDAGDFWDSALYGRIDHVGGAPSRQHYSSAAASSIVRNHRNALVFPATRLPPEIIFHIFLFVTETERQTVKALCNITRVCRRWREIALDCPRLWSRIDCEHSDLWMAAMIECSRAVPLSLTIADRAGINAQKTALILINMHHFELLDLHFSLSVVHTLPDMFTWPFPLLQRLKLSGWSIHTFAFSPKFLGGTAPNLRHFKLSTRSYMPWNSPLFTNLVTLEVDGYGDDTPDVTDSLSLEESLSALTGMPGLELLVLRRCFPFPAPSTTTYRHVDLPKLKRLEIQATLGHCACFLVQFTVHASTTVLLDLEHYNVAKEGVDELFTVFPPLLCAAAPIPARALALTRHHLSDVAVDAWRIAQDAAAASANAADIKLICICKSANWQVISPLDLAWACCEVFALPQLRSFRISKDIVGWDVEMWRGLARMSPDLQELAAGSSSESVGLCMALRPPDGGDLALANCCLPALSRLELAVDRSELLLTPDEGEIRLSEVLPRWLAARAKIGCSTPEVVFVEPMSEDSQEG